MHCAPLVIGVSGPTLTKREHALFAKIRPLAFILFARNIQNPAQTKALIDELKPLCGGPLPLIAIDQEGGRVQRLHFNGRLPPVRGLGAWLEAEGEAVLPQALQAAHLYGQLLAAEMQTVGANWLFAPVLDVSGPATHAIIGNRAFAANPQHITALARAYMQGLQQGGCLACIKHIPGHGRARADSHTELPVVAEPENLLLADARPFADLASLADSAMTAHIKYTAWDDANPATWSASVIQNIIRGKLNFNNVLVADDVGMQALHGPYVQRINKALTAGCDVAITALSQLQHGMAGTVWNEGHFTELEAAAQSLPNLTKHAWARVPQTLPAMVQAGAGNMRAALSAMWLSGPAKLGYPWPE
jgi:beta-N-acetylhexosaminidase